jgi:hypothetical protein
MLNKCRLGLLFAVEVPVSQLMTSHGKLAFFSDLYDFWGLAPRRRFDHKSRNRFQRHAD